MNQNPAPNEPGLYTFHALADQAQDPNYDPAQVLHHLENNMAAMNHLQQQFGSLQAQLQEQQASQATHPQAPITSLHAAIEALANSHLEQQQMQQTFQAGVQSVLERLSQRASQSPRFPVPLPLSTKFKGKDEELTFDEFKSKLQTAFTRFPESLAADTEKIHYALQSMEGTPARYFAPYVNEDIPDDDGILSSYESFIKTLDDIYGDKHHVDEVNHKLTRLRQTGSMTEYIASFRALAARSRWNEPALLSRFKDGLSDDTKLVMTAQWHSLTTLKGAQAAATTAYQNLQAQQRLRSRNGFFKSPQHQSPRRPAPSPAAPT
ncbi:hypothetical protein BGX34_000651, partial [Mortierella sp. NVP85]